MRLLHVGFSNVQDEEEKKREEQQVMLRVKLLLNENGIPSLYWMIDPCLPEILLQMRTCLSFGSMQYLERKDLYVYI
ncbi:hypothetical protein MKW98_020016, partial [Papaver atlanticum]